MDRNTKRLLERIQPHRQMAQKEVVKESGRKCRTLLHLLVVASSVLASLSVTPSLSAAPLPAVAMPQVTTAATCDTACKLFNDSAALLQQSPSPFATPIGGHAETSAIIWNGQYFMYYRTFVSPTGSTCSIPQGIAMAISTDSGISWTPVNGGRPLSALQTVQQGQSCSFDNSVRSTWVYAPDVTTDGSRLVMVFEQRDHEPNYFGPGQGRSLHSIRYVTSTDGHNWSNSTRILKEGAVGAWDDEVGTPDIEKDGTGYILTFHGHDSTGRLKQGRAMVRLGGLVEDYSGTRSKFVLSSAPVWANYGMGMGDMTREPDGYWYMIFEAFSGASGACGRTDTQTAVGIARSVDARNWAVRGAPLLYGRDSKSCGWDMPAWQNLGNVRGIVTPNDPPEGAALVRWHIINKVAPVAVTSGSQLRQNQYLPANAALYSSDGRARLIMQSDGNLVLYRVSDGYVIWASDTNGSGATRAYLQYDGNLVLQRADGSPVRATATDGRPGATLFVRSDRVLIDVYGTTIWQRPQPARGM